MITIIEISNENIPAVGFLSVIVVQHESAREAAILTRPCPT